MDMEAEHQAGRTEGGLCHIPSDLAADHWTSDGESRSHRDVLLLHNVWTTSHRLSGHTNNINNINGLNSTTKSSGFWDFLQNS